MLSCYFLEVVLRTPYVVKSNQYYSVESDQDAYVLQSITLTKGHAKLLSHSNNNGVILPVMLEPSKSSLKLQILHQELERCGGGSRSQHQPCTQHRRFALWPSALFQHSERLKKLRNNDMMIS